MNTRAVAASTTDAIDLLSDFRGELGVTANPPGMTILRIRGIVTARPDTFTGASKLIVAAKVDGKNEFAAPELNEGPNTAKYDNWMMYEPFQFSAPDAGGGITDLQWQTPGLSRVIDVRSRRKLDEIGMTLWLITETNTAVSWDYAAFFSVLLALP